MRCVIIAGSPETSMSLIASVVKPSDYVICADRGCRYAKEANIVPNLVVSDFDSEPEVLFPGCETEKLKPEKDDTDTMHAVDVALDRGFDDIAVLGALGGRLDHSFANLAVIARVSEKGGRGIILSENEIVQYLPVGEYTFEHLNGKTFSLFPFGCSSVCISCNGVKYPLDRGEISYSVTLGVSNVFTEICSSVTVHDGAAVIMINLNIS